MYYTISFHRHWTSGESRYIYFDSVPTVPFIITLFFYLLGTKSSNLNKYSNLEIYFITEVSVRLQLILSLKPCFEIFFTEFHISIYRWRDIQEIKLVTKKFLNVQKPIFTEYN